MPYEPSTFTTMVFVCLLLNSGSVRLKREPQSDGWQTLQIPHVSFKHQRATAKGSIAKETHLREHWDLMCLHIHTQTASVSPARQGESYQISMISEDVALFSSDKSCKPLRACLRLLSISVQRFSWFNAVSWVSGTFYLDHTCITITYYLPWLFPGKTVNYIPVSQGLVEIHV